MDMAYDMNPRLPRIRMEAVRLVVEKKWSTREVSRYLGYSQSVIVKWVQRSKYIPSNSHIIPTRSSRPHSHPRELPKEIVYAVLEYRQRYQRCAEVLHHLLLKDGYELSLSSVKRILKRHGCTRYSKWKKWHTYSPRPMPEKPGILVEIDTIHDGYHDDRLYLYTMLDVCTRWAHAWPVEHISTHESLRFVKEARGIVPFPIGTLQSDHGPEFSKWFTKQCVLEGLEHRHSRVRKPTDNGHLERFNRTIQEECLRYVPRSISAYREAVSEYLEWYNTGRPHMALNMLTPAEVITSY